MPPVGVGLDASHWLIFGCVVDKTKPGSRNKKFFAESGVSVRLNVSVHQSMYFVHIKVII